jgi:hypothetical protein
MSISGEGLLEVGDLLESVDEMGKGDGIGLEGVQQLQYFLEFNVVLYL